MKTLCFTLFILISSITLSQFTLSNEKTFGGNSDDRIIAKFEFNNTYYYSEIVILLHLGINHMIALDNRIFG